MKIRDFKLECYFGIYEFTAPYLLTQSDCESMTTQELLDMEPGAKEEYLQQWLGKSGAERDHRFPLQDDEIRKCSGLPRRSGSDLCIYERTARSGRSHDRYVPELSVRL